MLFTAGVSSNLCMSLSRWLGEGRMDGGLQLNMYFCFFGVWVDSWSGRGRLEGGLRVETLTAIDDFVQTK